MKTLIKLIFILLFVGCIKESIEPKPPELEDFNIEWTWTVISGSVRFYYTISNDGEKHWKSSHLWISNAPVYGDINFEYIYGEDPDSTAKFTALVTDSIVEVPRKEDWIISHPAPSEKVSGKYTLIEAGVGYRRYEKE